MHKHNIIMNFEIIKVEFGWLLTETRERGGEGGREVNGGKEVRDENLHQLSVIQPISQCMSSVLSLEVV